MATIRDQGTRQDTFVLRLTINGENWGIWDKKTGGDQDSDASTYYPGGMKDQVDLGGRSTASNITIQRLYDRADDHDRVERLLAAPGRAKYTLAQRPMDKDENEYGKSIVWTGTVKRCLPPDVDSESSTAAMIELELTVKGRPAVV